MLSLPIIWPFATFFGFELACYVGKELLNLTSFRLRVLQGGPADPIGPFTVPFEDWRMYYIPEGVASSRVLFELL